MNVDEFEMKISKVEDEEKKKKVVVVGTPWHA